MKQQKESSSVITHGGGRACICCTQVALFGSSSDAHAPHRCYIVLTDGKTSCGKTLYGGRWVNKTLQMACWKECDASFVNTELKPRQNQKARTLTDLFVGQKAHTRGRTHVAQRSPRVWIHQERCLARGDLRACRGHQVVGRHKARGTAIASFVLFRRCLQIV